ncbi:MAG: hypothetical protein PHS14_20805, partial [Elusimicrobia bacterium]|nr:hypothetical protein [Elusimicrobiota bacterium]
MAEIGSLVVRLNMDGSDFQRNIGKARDGLQETGAMSSKTEHALSQMAAKGFGTAIPAAEGFEHQLSRGIAQMSKATGWLGMLGQAAVIAGGALLVAAGVQALQHWIRTGEAIWKVKENLEKLTQAANDERAAIDKRIALQRTMMTTLAQLLGDEVTAVRIAEQARRDEITKTFAFGAQRNAQLAKSDEITYLQLKKLRDTRDDEELKKLQELRDSQIKAWQQETGALIEQYKARLTARQQFEAQLGVGAPPGSAMEGIRKALDLQKEFEKGLRDIAGAERLGFLSPRDAADAREALRQRISAMGSAIREEFGKIPAVVDLVQQTLNKVDTGQFGTEIEKARVWAEKFVETDQELSQSLDDVYRRLSVDIPAGVDRASAEFKKMADDAN